MMRTVNIKNVEKALKRAGDKTTKGFQESRTGRYILQGTDYSFNPTGGPIDKPEEYAPLFKALGLALASWSRMEQMLLNLTVHVNKEKASEKFYNPKLSHNFKDMTETLEKWLAENHKDLFPGKNYFIHLREFSDLRNKIAHGMIEKFDETNKIFKINIVSRSGKDKWGYMSIEYELSVLDDIACLANAANRDFAKMAEKIFAKKN